MMDISRIYHNNFLITYSTHPVNPGQPSAEKTQRNIQEDRRQRRERRKHKQKTLIERRVSSERRGPEFDAKA
ncbi:hypothetical protein [Methylophaga pinxianii]|uniref:hypothetical protein n=1 Tax=Methylophaga pinxianii TaxID=2881052 RepID=UPI001CF35904|nr:hypothetical protein [Methylophaga pinxianii]MCB2426558.1 hypothetical protein [Methylophaga pinxianii]UPH44879.1 hypothetical protein LGT42_010180 [Methylophaga pinxianii]